MHVIIKKQRKIYMITIINVDINYFARTAQRMRFSFIDFCSKYKQIRRKLRIWSIYTEKILNGKLHFLCSAG